MSTNASAPFDRLLDALGDGVTRRSDSSASARCSGHDDNRASLSIRKAEDGTVLLKCHKGCELSAILKPIGLTVSDLFPNNAKGSNMIERHSQSS